MKLEYDFSTNRYNDLHCGNKLKVKTNGIFEKVRIEYSDNLGWYFIYSNGVKRTCKSLEGSEIELN